MASENVTKVMTTLFGDIPYLSKVVTTSQTDTSTTFDSIVDAAPANTVVGLDINGYVSEFGYNNRSFALVWRTASNAWAWALVFNFQHMYYCTRRNSTTFTVNTIV